MKAVVLSCAAALVAGAGMAFPVSAQEGRQPTFEGQMQAQEQAARARQAESERQARAMLERDLAVGNMTPEQQGEFIRYAQERIEQTVPAARELQRNVRRTADARGNQMAQSGGNLESAMDTGNPREVSDREFAQAASHGVTEVATQSLGTTRELVRDSREFLNQMAAASADIMRERERIILGNANVSAAERERVQRETNEQVRASEKFQQTSEARFNEADYRLRERERIIRENEAVLAQRIETQIAQHGRDPTNWDRPAPSSTASSAPIRMPPPVAQSVPPSGTIEPSPPQPSAGTSAPAVSRPRRGTIPGQGGDPYAGLRVPRSQGGTGAETAESRAAADARAQAQQAAQARTQAQQQAERNAERTERLRQEAMEQARRDNEAMDPERQRQLQEVMNRVQQEREYQETLEMLRRYSRPGQVGMGASGGSGSGLGGQGSWLGFTDYSDMSVEDMLMHAALLRREAEQREALRVADENRRLLANAQRLAAQDSRWRQLVQDRFGNGAWDAFANGATVTTLQLLDIYANYDPNQAIPPARSLSSAGTSLSSVGWSLSSAGLDYRDPAVESLNEVLYGLSTRRRSPFDLGDHGDPARAAQMAYNAGAFDVRYNRSSIENFESGGRLVANLFDTEDAWLRFIRSNGFSGLDALLAQPFNVVLTWGADAYDLDLHMTGPLGEGATSRFHIYYAAPGALDAQPFAALIKDCICASGSEVLLTSDLNRGGVYRVSVFNYGDQSAASTNLSSQSGAQIQIVRGGTAQSVGNGTTIVGGHAIVTTRVPGAGAGNTWVAVELDPRNGRITLPDRITQSPGSGGVQ